MKLKPTSEYYSGLPKKRMAAGALFFNGSNELLIVKPSYKAWWSIPGGVIDENESPRTGCIREVKEEIGLIIESLQLLCVDWTSPLPEKGESVQVIFYGGVLNDQQIADIKLCQEEITEYKFLPTTEAIVILSDKLQRRLPNCIEALKANTVAYLEDGKLVC